jgi:hypothetical protein
MSDTEARAIQIFNNGNEELGVIDYSGSDIKKLVNNIKQMFGEPLMIVNIKDVSISLQ